MCQCIDVLCVCILFIYSYNYLIKKGGTLHYTHHLIYMN